MSTTPQWTEQFTRGYSWVRKTVDRVFSVQDAENYISQSFNRSEADEEFDAGARYAIAELRALADTARGTEIHCAVEQQLKACATPGSFFNPATAEIQRRAAIKEQQAPDLNAGVLRYANVHKEVYGRAADILCFKEPSSNEGMAKRGEYLHREMPVIVQSQQAHEALVKQVEFHKSWNEQRRSQIVQLEEEVKGLRCRVKKLEAELNLTGIDKEEIDELGALVEVKDGQRLASAVIEWVKGMKVLRETQRKSIISYQDERKFMREKMADLLR